MKVDTLVTTAARIIIMKTLTIKKTVSAIAKNVDAMIPHATIAIAIAIATIASARGHLTPAASK